MDDFYSMNEHQTDFAVIMLHAYRESMHDFISQMSQLDKDRYYKILGYYMVNQ